MKTVLLVEDDPEVRDTTREALERMGFYVVSAADGMEALEVLRSTGSVSLILLDLMMPRMNGFEFRQRQRQDPTLAGIPVIVVTAYGQLAEKVQELGSVSTLRKPIDFDELSALLQRLVE
jgi:two-component system, chemotaxis family, chemotaxis protein CheY